MAPPITGVFKALAGLPVSLPYFTEKVPAGFPSPAEGYAEENLDITSLLMPRPAATYYVRCKGDSMTGAGIHDDDLLVVDRSLKASSGDIILAVLDGKVTVKRLLLTSRECLLMPENPRYQPIRLHEGNELQCWGVVMFVIHKTR